MPSGPWDQYKAQQTPAEQGPWSQYAGPAPTATMNPEAPQSDPRNAFQRGFDELVHPSAEQSAAEQEALRGMGVTHTIPHAFQEFGSGEAEPLSMIAHPLQTLKSMATARPSVGSMILGPGYDLAKGIFDEARESPARAAGNLTGQALLGAATGEALKAPGAIRELAMGDPDAAALRALKIPSGSTKAIRALGAVEGARPFLKGVKSIEEAQARIPVAKEEIWGPYQKTIEQIGPRPVKGPDGMTTVQALEDERQQLSALNRGLKNGDPSAVQLAQQKGMSQAQLLDREKAVQAHLDPALEMAGIKPQAIRKAFGQVSQVGQRVLGRSTLTENAPYGIGRIRNFSLNPFRDVRQIAEAGRDIAAGRPWWSGSPSDINLREAFRFGGEKPEFGAPRPLPRFQLPAAATVREGEENLGPWQFGIRNEPQITPPPRAFAQLPARATEGEAQPMLMNRLPFHPGVAPEFSSERILPTRFHAPEIIPPRVRISGPEGIRTAPRALLHSGAPEELPDSSVRIHPPGSTHPLFDEDLYPRGSKFGRKQVPEGEGDFGGQWQFGIPDEPQVTPPAPDELSDSSVRIHPPGSQHPLFDEDLYPRGSKFGRKH